MGREVPTNSSDLGLAITPFEALYDSAHTADIPADAAPFDPEAELAHAEQVGCKTHYQQGPTLYDWWFPTAPLFTTFPGVERRSWWREHLRSLRTSERVRPTWLAEELMVPDWVRTILLSRWEATPRALARRLAKQGAEVLLLRGLLHLLDPVAVAAARADLPAELPCPVRRDRQGVWRVLDLTALRAAGLGCLSATAARRLLAEIPDGALAEPQLTEVWPLALLAPTPRERVAFAVRTGLRLTTWRAVVPWLVATGQTGLALLGEQIAAAAPPIAHTMARTAAAMLHGPAAAPLFLDLLATGQAPVADRWLTAHTTQLIAAPVDTTQAAVSARYLRQLPLAELQTHRAQACPQLRPLIDGIIGAAQLPHLDAATSWWSQAQAAKRLRHVAPVPFPPVRLPPLVVDGQRLAAPELQTLLRALAVGACPPPPGTCTETRWAAQQPHPLVEAVAERLSPAARSSFARELVAQWQVAGRPAKQGWLASAPRQLRARPLLERDRC